jgi:hypothetical protein
MIVNVAGMRTLEDCAVVVVVVVEVEVEVEVEVILDLDVEDPVLVDGAAAALELVVVDDELAELEWLDPPHAPIIRKMGIRNTTAKTALTRASINADNRS